MRLLPRVARGRRDRDLTQEDRNEASRGIASETLASNPEKSEKRINKVVKKLFKKFPAAAD